MKKNNLVPNKGLSLSQAKSISNLCNQRAGEIGMILTSINNYGKTMNIEGKNIVIQKGYPVPENIVDLLKEKSELHACQAFLMENLKAKGDLLIEIKGRNADITALKKPVIPQSITLDNPLLKEVTEDFGWEELKSTEYNEYLEAEAFASHIGQFIHKGSILSRLRDELPNVPAVEWMEIEKDKKSLVTIELHHESSKLLKTHEELAKLHREYEQRVNYFKAKVKNLTTNENARIAKVNADLQREMHDKNSSNINAYDVEMRKYMEDVNYIKKNFEIERQERIAEIAMMRIDVDKRFQKVIDIFMNQLPVEDK